MREGCEDVENRRSFACCWSGEDAREEIAGAIGTEADRARWELGECKEFGDDGE